MHLPQSRMKEGVPSVLPGWKIGRNHAVVNEIRHSRNFTTIRGSVRPGWRLPRSSKFRLPLTMPVANSESVRCGTASTICCAVPIVLPGARPLNDSSVSPACDDVLMMGGATALTFALCEASSMEFGRACVADNVVATLKKSVRDRESDAARYPCDDNFAVSAHPSTRIGGSTSR
jgi:hypothetical protein